MCKWNLRKLAEALKPALPLDVGIKIVNETFDSEYNLHYGDIMRRKLGLQHEMSESTTHNDITVASDREIIEEFLETMKLTGGDFTNCFRSLSTMSLPNLPDFEKSYEKTLEKLLKNCATHETMLKQAESSINSRQVQLILMLLESSPDVLARLGFEQEQLSSMLSKVERVKELREREPDAKSANDRELWTKWLNSYKTRLTYDYRDGPTEHEALSELDTIRMSTMNSTNPRFVLRNYLAQQAIAKAEKGDFSEVNKLYRILQDPYSDKVSSMSAIYPC